VGEDPNKVWPTGLTLREAEALHRYLIEGTRVFGLIAICAHVLAYALSPWLK
jgi:light-harvesting protein B-800-850 beta chain